MRKHSFKKMKNKTIYLNSEKICKFEISVNVWLISALDLKITFFWKLNICFRTISNPEQPCMCYFGWIQWQPFKCFLLSVFVFFITFLKKMGIILSASKPHCHSRLSEPILKILSIYRENILGKQLSKAI